MDTAWLMAFMGVTSLTLTRHVRTEVGGGYKWVTTELDPQDFYIYYGSVGQGGDMEHATTGGRNVRFDLMLLGTIEADIEGAPPDNTLDAWDSFTYGEREYRVVFVRTYDITPLQGFKMVQAGCVPL